MILDYPDHTLLFPKKEETLTRCRFRPIPRQSFLLFFFFRLYITQLSLAVLYRTAEQIFLLCQP